ncbi:hypothetical protein OSCT_1675 [Oscillochloris trichoides DG-6]|uniref:Uncharacterized protein n=1 Tax=Oscillochloris trichoides DG-6 TaxID=765420 RepID=E1IEC4_9CHLR|nr:hypothetical protein [Oscillochloris trichoides]EFO80450.1 hypothetical protein OSCT_1675 [Oscillochloris trichoides DG-6]
MPIVIANRRTSITTLQQRFGAATLLDVTSQGPAPWVRFSPFYPHGAIPVPLSPGMTAASVEGIWQGLKVFTHANIDLNTMTNTTMRGLKRTTRRFGAVQGHRAGVAGTTLLDYATARQRIYLPAYRWVLDHCLQPELDDLRQRASQGLVVLLDYETNTDLADLRRPLSHAGLIIRYLDGTWPVS